MENTTKQVIVGAMLQQIKTGSEIHIASYKVAFPTVNARTLRTHREMAQAEYRGELKVLEQEIDKTISHEIELVDSIERYHGWSVMFAFISGVTSTAILFFIIR
jgi:hypothetical protein